MLWSEPRKPWAHLEAAAVGKELDRENSQKCRRFSKPSRCFMACLLLSSLLLTLLAATCSLLPMGAGSSSLRILTSHLSSVLYRGQSQGHPNNPHKKYVGKGETEESISAFLKVLRVLKSYFFGETTCRHPEKTIQLEKEARSAFRFLGLTRTT